MPERHYTVTSQREDRGFGADGRTTDVVVISYQGPAGIIGTIEVPLNEYTPQRVDQIIRERLHRHLQVRQLGEHPPG